MYFQLYPGVKKKNQWDVIFKCDSRSEFCPVESSRSRSNSAPSGLFLSSDSSCNHFLLKQDSGFTSPTEQIRPKESREGREDSKRVQELTL